MINAQHRVRVRFVVIIPVSSSVNGTAMFAAQALPAIRARLALGISFCSSFLRIAAFELCILGIFVYFFCSGGSLGIHFIIILENKDEISQPGVSGLKCKANISYRVESRVH